MVSASGQRSAELLVRKLHGFGDYLVLRRQHSEYEFWKLNTIVKFEYDGLLRF